MKVLVCTGDSHTWGQGAANAGASLSPPPESGDLRPLSFSSGGYVNRLRRRINLKLGSRASELEAADLARERRTPLVEGCYPIGDALRVRVNASRVRLIFRSQAGPSRAFLFVNGECMREVSLRTLCAPGYGFSGFQSVFLEAQSDSCLLEVIPTAGRPLLYRMEFYAGSCSVVNCGIGSVSTARFMSDYWSDYVTALHPCAVLVQAHTINDWLTGCTPEKYQKNLSVYLKKIRMLGATPVLLTTSPIQGEQARPFNDAPYDTFVDASREVAVHEGCLLADANARMQNLIKERGADGLFSDNWHVTDLGHEIYAQCAYETLFPEDGAHPERTGAL